MSHLPTAPEAGTNVSTNAERRAWVRYQCDLDSCCRPVISAAGRPWPARVRNVSAGGLCLALDRRFEPGVLLSVEVQRGDTGTSFTFVARVVHVSREECGNWLLGCAFRSVLTEDETQSLV